MTEPGYQEPVSRLVHVNDASIVESAVPSSVQPLGVYVLRVDSPDRGDVVLAVIAEALQGMRLRFDLVIADEAHHCAGFTSSAFATALDQSQIPARKRVFMTATPRYFTGGVLI